MNEARTRRQRAIADVIRGEAVTSQEDVTERLAAMGLAVTQATVSRDLDQLGAVKVKRDGVLRYALPDQIGPSDWSAGRLERILSEWVLSVEAAGSLIIIKTPPGSAHLVASSIECFIAQRLARRVCPSCRKPASVPGAEVGLDGGTVEVFEAVGCPRCRQLGYRGRLGLFEVMPVSDEIRALIVQRAPAGEIARVAVAQGMRTLRDDGLAKVRAGDTSLAEVARVTG